MDEITRTERDYKHVLTGSFATIDVNPPRALMQLSVETKLRELYWVVGKTYKSKLKGTNT